MFRNFKAEARKHPLAFLVFFSPSLALLALTALSDFSCTSIYAHNPQLGITHSLVWLLASVALLQLSQPFCETLVGKDPVFGTQLFALAFLSVNINAVLSIALLLPYKLIVAVLGAPCG